MKRIVVIGGFVAVVVLAVYAGERMDDGVAALVGGLGLGLGLAAVGALIYAVVREDRDRRDRRAAEEAWRRQPARETWTEAAWREWTEASTSSTNGVTNARMLGAGTAERAKEAAGRAVVVRREEFR